MTKPAKPGDGAPNEEHEELDLPIEIEESAEPPALPEEDGAGAKGDNPPFSVRDKRFWAQSDSPEKAEGEEEAPPAPVKPTYIQQLEARIEEQEARLKSYIEAHKAAERRFEESKARIARQVEAEVERARDDLVSRLFDVLDNLDRSVEAATGERNFEALRDGLNMVQRQFLATLEEMGLTRLDPVGQPFDPAYHEAVSVVPVATQEADQKVQHVLRSGYVRGERVLRAAMVTVGRKG